MYKNLRIPPLMLRPRTRALQICMFSATCAKLSCGILYFFSHHMAPRSEIFFFPPPQQQKNLRFLGTKARLAAAQKGRFPYKKRRKKSEERSEKCDSTTRVAQPLRITSDERVDDFLRNCVEFFGYDFSELVRIHFAAQSDDSVRNFALHEGP